METRNKSQNKHYLENREIILERNSSWYQNNKEYRKIYNKIYKECLYQYQDSWGGRVDRNNNSLLKIDVNLFREQ